MYVNPEDCDVDFAFPNFNLALFPWEWSCGRNWIVTLPRKRIPVSVWKFLRRSQLKMRMNWQKERFSQKQLTSESFDNDNKLTLKSFFAFCSAFSQRQTEERWKRLLDRHNVRPVSKILQHYIKELKLTVLLVLTKQTFLTWRICFYFLRKPLLCAIVFVCQ